MTSPGPSTTPGYRRSFASLTTEPGLRSGRCRRTTAEDLGTIAVEFVAVGGPARAQLLHRFRAPRRAGLTETGTYLARLDGRSASAVNGRRRATVDGWCSVEELTRLGFARSPVVMANEAHNGLTRCVRTREVGVRMIQAAHQAGVRRLAMEALPSPANGAPEPIRDIPSGDGGYLAQPDMRRLITTALELGWSLWAYEAVFETTPDADPAAFLSMEFTNWREREQAANL